MKTTTFFISAIVSVMFFTSCSSYYKYTSRVAETQTENNIYITPSVVDVRIDFAKKITASSDLQATEDAARENAYYKAIQDNGIDILISPVYELRIESNGGKAKATVTGYAGYFVNSRTVAEDKKIAYDAKIVALEKMLKLEPLVKEEQKIVLVNGGSNVTTGTNNGVTTISNAAPSIIEKFMILYGTDNSVSAKSQNVNSAPKNQSIFGGFVKGIVGK